MADVREFTARWLEQDALILDTETTGLDEQAQVVEDSLINPRGEIVLDTLVRPKRLPGTNILVPDTAAAIHGITDDMLADAPTWEAVHADFCQAVYNRPVVIYNQAYDVRLLRQTAAFCALYDPLQWASSIHCAMLAYAEYRGIWNKSKGGYKWHKLTDAALHEGINISEIQAHRALGDCRMTLEIIKAMAGTEVAA